MTNSPASCSGRRPGQPLHGRGAQAGAGPGRQRRRRHGAQRDLAQCHREPLAGGGGDHRRAGTFGLPAGCSARCRSCLAALDAARGMGDSIAAGVSARADARGLAGAAGRHAAGAAGHAAAGGRRRCGRTPVAYAQYRGRRGHPVGFSRRAVSPNWWRCTGDEGARRLVARYPAQAVEVDDPGVLIDIDTVADLAAPAGSAAAAAPPRPPSTARGTEASPVASQAVAPRQRDQALDLAVAHAALAQGACGLEQVVQRACRSGRARGAGCAAAGRRAGGRVCCGLRRLSVKASAWTAPCGGAAGQPARVVDAGGHLALPQPLELVGARARAACGRPRRGRSRRAAARTPGPAAPACRG